MVAPPDSAAEPTLRPDAVGFLDTLVIGPASTSPAYSLAAVLGPIVALVGVHAPGVTLTGLACAVFFRRRLLDGARDFLLLGAGPLAGAAMLAWLLVLSVRDLADAENSYTGQAWPGVGPPLVIGAGVLAAGVVLMLCWRRRDATFWRDPVSAGGRRS